MPPPAEPFLLPAHPATWEKAGLDTFKTSWVRTPTPGWADPADMQGCAQQVAEGSCPIHAGADAAEGRSGGLGQGSRRQLKADSGLWHSPTGQAWASQHGWESRGQAPLEQGQHSQ